MPERFPSSRCVGKMRNASTHLGTCRPVTSRGVTAPQLGREKLIIRCRHTTTWPPSCQVRPANHRSADRGNFCPLSVRRSTTLFASTIRKPTAQRKTKSDENAMNRNCKVSLLCKWFLAFCIHCIFRSWYFTQPAKITFSATEINR